MALSRPGAGEKQSDSCLKFWEPVSSINSMVPFDFLTLHNGLPGFKKGHPLYLRQNEGQKMDLFYDLSGSARPWGLTKVDFVTLA